MLATTRTGYCGLSGRANPSTSISRIMNGLDPEAQQAMLCYLAGLAPEAFEDALLFVSNERRRAALA